MCIRDSDFSAPLGDPNEAMLSTAMIYASTGSCPTTAVASRDVNGPQSSKTAGTVSDPFMDDPRIKTYFANKNRAEMFDFSELKTTAQINE